MPDERANVPYARTFTGPEYIRLQRGLVPEQMEDKWFIFCEAPWLFLHRSWTGVCVYAVKLRADGEGAAVEEACVNRVPEEYRETDIEHDAKILAFLVDRLLWVCRQRFQCGRASTPKKGPCSCITSWGTAGRTTKGRAGQLPSWPHALLRKHGASIPRPRSRQRTRSRTT
jgi:hypothetical protein